MPVAEKPFEKNYPFTMLGFETSKVTGHEHIGNCVFCDKPGKMYINAATGQWGCKAGDCMAEGNVYTFIQKYYNDVCVTPAEDPACQKKFAELAQNRGFSVEDLIFGGVRWSDELERYILPVYNEKGTLVNLRIYLPGKKTYSLTGLKLSPDGLLALASNPDWPVFICEGEWDALAMKLLLRDAGVNGIVICIHGSGVFAKEWAVHFKGRHVICCYDNDVAGEQGRDKAHGRLLGVCLDFKYIAWPKDLPPKFDIRDLYRKKGTYQIIEQMLEDYAYPEDRSTPVVDFPNLMDGGRPSFDETVEVFERHMKFTKEMRWGLKLIFAASYANNFRSIPVWLHIVGPAGCGKTELLMGLSTASNTEIRSTVTAKSLVSGFSLPGGRDPSLLPMLFRKLFILKDYTEILQMCKVEKEEVDSILRGAYDGVVTKQFGNGIMRHFVGTFNMITGVTQEVFRESHTSLGERFLMFHMLKGVGNDVDDIIAAALSNEGHELEMRTDMCEAAKKFVEWKFEQNQLPPLDEKFLGPSGMISGLAQTVAVLRGSVQRDFRGENILFNPQHETGTRLAKQMKIWLMSLGSENEDFAPNEEDWQIVTRIGLDSCRGFNLDIAIHVASNPNSTIADLWKATNIPHTTLRTLLDDLTRLGFLEESKLHVGTSGQPANVYNLTDHARRNWERANLFCAAEIKSEKPKQRAKFKKNVVIAKPTTKSIMLKKAATS